MDDSFVTVLGVVAATIIVLLLLRARVRSQNPDTNPPASVSTSSLGPGEIESYLRLHITEIAREQFPDNPDVDWLLRGFRYRQDLALVLAEVEPRPAEVGYERFQFAFLAAPKGPPKHVATYCLESGEYTLLSTSRGAPANLPKRLD